MGRQNDFKSSGMNSYFYIKILIFNGSVKSFLEEEMIF